MTTVELGTWTDTKVAVTHSSSWLTFSAEMLYARLQNMKRMLGYETKFVGNTVTFTIMAAVKTK